MYGIEIKDARQGVLTVHLRDILGAIADQVAGWDWSLLHLWAVGDLPGTKTVVDYEKLAAHSPATGARLDAAEVERLAEHADQIIDAVIVGNANPREVGKAYADGGVYRDNDLVIEANDSTGWRVVSKRAELIDALRRRFADVTEVQDFESMGD